MRVVGRIWVAAGLGAACLMLAAACTSDDSAPAAGATTSGRTSVPTTTDQSTDTEVDPSEAPFEPRTVTVVMNGDMLLHEGLWSTAEIDAGRTGRGDMDFRPLLADMRSVIKPADLSICHMETPLAPAGGPYQGYPLFSAPPAIVPALKWEGYDVCTTASNHSIDQGFDGLARTIADLRGAGIATNGTSVTKKASKRPLLVEVGDVKVALISATYGTNGLPLPSDQPWSVQLIDTDAIEAKAARARAAGADVVMVALQWGLEYQHSPTPDQEAIAETLTRSPDIDFIYGHHAHVVQPYDKVNKRWVVYGLGNAVAQQSTSVEGVYDGNTCRVTFTERPNGSFKVSKLEYIPTMITHFDGSNPMRWLNVSKSLADPAYAGLHDGLEATDQRVTDVVGSLGAFDKGVVEGQ
jgi:poly-gamma-glutamate capsule biosynthesis protein CapA/YwtB (metallophosphatase superfamily)